MIVRHRLTTLAVLACLGVLAATPGARAGTVDEDSVAQMTRREKAGQLVMAPVSGTTLTASDLRLIRDHGMGGVILFSINYRNASQLRRLTRAIQAAARNSSAGLRALIATDQEGGVVQRFPDLAPASGAPQANTLQRAETMGRTTGRDLHDVGVNVNFAPVADLDRGPAHVMAARAFGRRPATVRARISAYLDGILPTRVGAAVKHFPGMGAASANTDDGRVVIRLSRDELRIDETPFLAARGRNKVAVMMSNAIYPAYQGGTPASISPPMYQHLRYRLGGATLVITDALDAIAWAFDGITAKACPRAIIAGADIALITDGPLEALSCIERIVDAARDGRITDERLDAATLRVLRYKRALGLIG